MTRNSVLTINFVLFAAVILAPPARGQYDYSLNYQTNTINVVSNWVGNGTYVVGSNTFLNALIIQNAGVLSHDIGLIGSQIGGSNNTVRVTGTGSVWSNLLLQVGSLGAGNQLVVTNGGAVFGFSSELGSGT